MIGQRPRRFRRWLWYTIGACVVVAGSVALAAFSPLLRIHDIDVQGVRSMDPETAAEKVALGYEGSMFGHQYRIPSLFNFDPAKGRAQLLAAFPQIADALVTRDWPHRVSVTVTERSPRGIWCRPSGEPRPADGAGRDFMCRFFDDHGIRWGTSVPSTGPLLLQVRDERSEDSLDDHLLKGLLAAVDGMPALGLRARMVTLPDAEPGGMRISVDKGYELYLDALSDVAQQLDTLGIFLTERSKDSSFQPSYIDLRTPGRIYYK